MDERTQELIAAVERWRGQGLVEYWLRVSYLGGELNRFGDHELTFAEGVLWHRWHGDWREIRPGSDFWLFSVPGALAWARDLLIKVLPDSGAPAEALRVRFNPEYGYVEHLQFEAGHRDATNFTFEVKRFEPSRHPEFQRPG